MENNKKGNKYFKYHKYGHNDGNYYKGNSHYKNMKYQKNKIKNNVLLQQDKKIQQEELTNKVFNGNDNQEKQQVEKLELTSTKKENNNGDSRLLFFKLALGVIVLAVLVFGVTLAYFNYYQEDSRQADITGGEVYISVYPAEAANITLTKMYPRTNEEARSRNDNYVDFKIRGKNTSSSKVLYYSLDITNGADVANKVRINPEYVKVDLEEKINGEYTYIQEAVNLSDFSFDGMIPINSTNQIEREFRLRIWISEDVLISDTEAGRTFTQSEFANLYANYHIVVNAVDRKPTAAQLISNVSGLEDVAGAKRYVGANPDNYVLFNCTNDSDTSTCEQWRIIGVYDGKLKIIKATPLTGLTDDQQKYNLQTSDGNAWEGSNLEIYLNQETDGGYYYSLSQTSKDMIVAGTWNAGATTSDATASQAHADAIGTPESIITRKVGLIATYEYLYAAGTSCQTIAGTNEDFRTNSGCALQDWLNQNFIMWTLSPYSVYSSQALRMHSYGYVLNNLVTTSYNVLPVVYLNSGVTITGGNGQSGSEYTLSYTVS